MHSAPWKRLKHFPPLEHSSKGRQSMVVKSIPTAPESTGPAILNTKGQLGFIWWERVPWEVHRLLWQTLNYGKKMVVNLHLAVEDLQCNVSCYNFQCKGSNRTSCRRCLGSSCNTECKYKRPCHTCCGESCGRYWQWLE